MTETPTLNLSETVARRLDHESMIWLTTVDRKGTPIPTPVWFLWSGGTFLLFSQPDTPKLSHIAANPRVALNLNADAHGGDVAVFVGTGVVDDASAEEWSLYTRKYERDMASLDYTPDGFRADYSVPVRIVPTRVRQW